MEGYPGKYDFLLFLRIHHDADVYAPIASCLCGSRFVKKAEMETPLYISYFLGKTKIVRYKSKCHWAKKWICFKFAQRKYDANLCKLGNKSEQRW